MKKIIPVLAILLMLASLFGCSSQTLSAYTARYNGITFNVDPMLGTITDDRYTYSYKFSGTAEKGTAEITYPDGSTYHFTMDGNGGYGGRSDDYSDEIYTDGSILCDILFDNAKSEKAKVGPFSIIVLLVCGAVMVAYPRKIWHLEYGWRFKNAEPSDTAIAANRIVGVVLICIAIIFIFIDLGL